MNEQATRTLAMYNRYRLEPGNLLEPHPLELGYVESIRQAVAPYIPPDVSFEWYENLLHSGPGQSDPLFPWLATTANRKQMIWFLQQEAGSEAGFDDLVAMAQVKMPTRVKLEMARNYWDEMGQGQERGMHGKLLDGVIQYFKIVPSLEATCSEPLLLSNLMVALAVHRRYAYQAIGALGVIEMTAPGRVAQVDQGLARLGVPKAERRYFTLHATLDIKHSREWNREVILPLAPTAIRAIAEGAYMRLWAGARCFARYRAELGLGDGA